MSSPSIVNILYIYSLCNTKATSKQTLLLHGDGKKHRAKARAFHAAKLQQTRQTESAQDKTAMNGNTTNGEMLDNEHVEEQKVQDLSKCERLSANSETETGKLQTNKKRKLDESGSDGTGQKTGGDATDKIGNGVFQVEGAKAEDSRLKKAKHNGLKDYKNPDGVLKMKKLKKLVLKSLQESGITEGETQISGMLEQKINSSSRFSVDGKYVRLVAKDGNMSNLIV
ncbi:hypothetical protein GH714_038644 [Hevea brasiliensis]|uniref:Cell growth-regulating nucleolar protein-like winged helix domain-containing protein n=1 Tax=Hevea brasiliensis TaxID=3981 RepID=A0A6A6KGA1_HEVBR|nr:hypothetical protein GH714_038644 [Hevea brasiliensis]